MFLLWSLLKFRHRLLTKGLFKLADAHLFMLTSLIGEGRKWYHLDDRVDRCIMVLKQGLYLLWDRWIVFFVAVDWGSCSRKTSTMEELRQQFWPADITQCKSLWKMTFSKDIVLIRKPRTWILPVKEVNKSVQSTPGFLQMTFRRLTTASLFTWVVMGEN